MAEAPRFTRRNHGNGHSYLLDGETIPGVTTIKNVLNKPALTTWAARMAADAVINEWDHLASLPVSERHAYVLKAPDRFRDAAAVRGTRVHRAAQSLIDGHPWDAPDELRGQAEALARFFDAWDAESVLVETSACSTVYRYGGTLDAVLYIPSLGNVLVDYKTRDDGRTPYPDVALQLAAYRACDLYLDEEEVFGPRGGRLKSIWHERRMPHVDHCAVIGVTPGSATLYPMRTDDEIFEGFLALLDAYRSFVMVTDYRNQDKEYWRPTVGDALYPESPEWPATL